MLCIQVAPEQVRERLWQLFLDYACELSKLDGQTRPRVKRHYDYFDRFWENDTCTPFAIVYDHDPIGFCFVEDTGVSYKITDFYIHPLHRRRGFGKEAVEYVKQHCRSLGRHKAITANVYVNNTPAIRFWQSVGFCDTGRRIRIKRIRLMEMECKL
ncbi:MAG: GNAT family N-acetyltransferase [Armatimonadota bacterium]|nr:GNAT family N-acetyltransferase [Armatimonadota bacterium]